MTAISKSNIKKTVYYLRRNGLRRTWYAVRERMEEAKKAPYVFEAISEKERQRQQDLAQKMWDEKRFALFFSIVVPTYRTDPRHLRAMIDSVRAQTYPFWELILADATEDESVAKIVSGYEGVQWINPDGEDGVLIRGERIAGRIRCVRLPENRGISENTNAALPFAEGDYIGLLDHDDLLAEDALFEMADRIRAQKEGGIDVRMLYSDEDKCNEDQSRYYEPNLKEKFNLDLILSNNYICHFLVMKNSLLKELKLRKAYDGAQDYDLVLRAVDRLHLLSEPREEEQVVHVPKVLYHWRCHPSSTAENPRSKQYAYDAGRLALQDFADRNHLTGKAVSSEHMGFYRLRYAGDVFAQRRDLGVVGGRIVSRGRIVGGRMDEEGTVLYEGLPAAYSGYLHRASLTQDADAVDIRCMAVREELQELFAQIAGVPYQCVPGKKYFDVSILPRGTDLKKLSIAFCRAVRERGYRILWMPKVTVEKNGRDYE